ncbi:MAG: hypothetical protein ACRD2N_02700 [Vicinamibacterales bacterium]
MRSALLATLVLIHLQAPTVSAPLDVSGVRPGPTSVVRSGNSVTVSWPDENARVWRATFSLDPAQPLVTSIGPEGEPVVRGARPFYQGETGKRRGGWYAFFDDPTSHPDGTRHVQGAFRLRGATARSIGDRVEIVFDGMRMGSFEGALAYTFYPGGRLVQQEAVLTTSDADVAYYYDTGLDMTAAADRQPGNNMRTEVAYYDTDGALRRSTLNGLQAERVPVQARYRTLALKTAGGSVAVLPAPHQYFFPRDFTSNLGFVWHRAWRGRVALGIRQLRDENWQYYPWVNAPPGRPQRMSVFFLLSTNPTETALTDVLRYTNADRFRPLDGYKTLSTHWHLADTVQAVANGAGWTPPFKPVLKAMGVDASMIMDFHGDGHPADLTDLRLDELHAYFGTLRAQSDAEFLLIPAEEANVHLGGHWAVVFPKPVYWFMDRPGNKAFVSTHPKYGTVYSVADAKEMFDLVSREGGYMYQTHPRTKGSTGFPDRILATDYFRHSSYVGAGWKALPSDLSSPRLGDRAFDLLDELNNQGLYKRLLGEVDVFQFDHTHELYAHMNVNYIKLNRLPTFDRWGDALAPLANGDFFVTTGEVLLPDVTLNSSSATEIVAKARVSWTFPLRFAELVWGDGQTTHREVIELADTREFGNRTFEWRAKASHWKWARVAVWDVAGNGAFVNPLWRP